MDNHTIFYFMYNEIKEYFIIQLTKIRAVY